MAQAFHIRDDFDGIGVLDNRLLPIQEGAASHLRWEAEDKIEDDETQTGWTVAGGRAQYRENYY